jgi:hypothetical protein
MALFAEFAQQVSQGFTAFWSRWPRKVDKAGAEREWNKTVKPSDEPLIHEALDWQLPEFERRDPEYIPHARTWLHNRRWDDEKPTTKKATTTASRPTEIPAWKRRHLPQERKL